MTFGGHRFVQNAGSLNACIAPGNLMIPLFLNSRDSRFVSYSAPDFTTHEDNWTFTRTGHINWPLEVFSILEDTTDMVHLFGIKGHKMAVEFTTRLSVDIHRAALKLLEPWWRFRKETEGKIRDALVTYAGELAQKGFHLLFYRPLRGQTTVDPDPNISEEGILASLIESTNLIFSNIGIQIKDYLSLKIQSARPAWHILQVLQNIISIMDKWAGQLPHPSVPSYALESMLIDRLSSTIRDLCQREMAENVAAQALPDNVPTTTPSPDNILHSPRAGVPSTQNTGTQLPPMVNDANLLNLNGMESLGLSAFLPGNSLVLGNNIESGNLPETLSFNNMPLATTLQPPPHDYPTATVSPVERLTSGFTYSWTSSLQALINDALESNNALVDEAETQTPLSGMMRGGNNDLAPNNNN